MVAPQGGSERVNAALGQKCAGLRWRNRSTVFPFTLARLRLSFSLMLHAFVPNCFAILCSQSTSRLHPVCRELCVPCVHSNANMCGHRGGVSHRYPAPFQTQFSYYINRFLASKYNSKGQHLFLRACERLCSVVLMASATQFFFGI